MKFIRSGQNLAGVIHPESAGITHSVTLGARLEEASRVEPADSVVDYLGR